VESYAHDTRSVIQTNSEVLWVDKLTSHFLSHNQQNTKEFDQHGK